MLSALKHVAYHIAIFFDLSTINNLIVTYDKHYLVLMLKSLRIRKDVATGVKATEGGVCFLFFSFASLRRDAKVKRRRDAKESSTAKD